MNANSTTLIRDILRAVTGAASHRCVAAGLGTSGLHTDECRECHAPVTPIPWGIRSYLVVLCRYPAPFAAGDTCETRAGIPKLSDCPDMRAVVPWFERRSLSSSRKSEIFERPRLNVQT